jgi:hypothetical protein
MKLSFYLLAIANNCLGLALIKIKYHLVRICLSGELLAESVSTLNR